MAMLAGESSKQADVFADLELLVDAALVRAFELSIEMQADTEAGTKLCWDRRRSPTSTPVT